MITITRRQKQVIDLMKSGLGRSGIARTIGVDPLTVYCHQKALERKGVVSPGTMNGQRRRVLKDGRSYRVESFCRIETAEANAKIRDAAWRARMVAAGRVPA